MYGNTNGADGDRGRQGGSLVGGWSSLAAAGKVPGRDASDDAVELGMGTGINNLYGSSRFIPCTDTRLRHQFCGLANGEKPPGACGPPGESAGRVSTKSSAFWPCAAACLEGSESSVANECRFPFPCPSQPSPGSGDASAPLPSCVGPDMQAG